MVTQVTFFISSELLSMPAVKRFSVSFAKHPTNGTSASLQVYFHFLHLPSFCMSMETFFHFGNLCWFYFLSRDFCHVSFDFSSFIIFLNIQPASYPSHTHHYRYLKNLLRTTLTLTQLLNVNQFTDDCLCG